MVTHHIRGKSLSLAVIFLACLALSCEDAPRNAVQSRPPQVKAAVTQAPASGAAIDVAHLPWRSELGACRSCRRRLPSTASVVIAFAQTQFENGQVEYHAGHLGAARHDFDSALDAILASGLDIEHDTKLGPLYHRILDTVSSEEFAAFREGDGFSEQKAEARADRRDPCGNWRRAGSGDPKLAASRQWNLPQCSMICP